MAFLGVLNVALLAVLRHILGLVDVFALLLVLDLALFFVNGVIDGIIDSLVAGFAISTMAMAVVTFSDGDSANDNNDRHQDVKVDVRTHSVSKNNCVSCNMYNIKFIPEK